MSADVTQTVSAALASKEALPGDVSATVVINLVGAPGGDQQLGLAVRSGKVEIASVESNPDVSVELKWSDAKDIAEGKLDPSVAYMQGRLKPSGQMTTVLQLLEIGSSSAFSRWLTV